MLVAEQIGTIAAFADGPFVVQTGLGGGREQFAAMGVPLKGRAAIFTGQFASTGIRPRFLDRLKISGVELPPNTFD